MKRQTIIAVSIALLALLAGGIAHSQAPYTPNVLTQPKFTGTVVGQYSLQPFNYSLGNAGQPGPQVTSALRIDTRTGKTSVLVRTTVSNQPVFAWVYVHETVGSQSPETKSD